MYDPWSEKKISVGRSYSKLTKDVQILICVNDRKKAINKDSPHQLLVLIKLPAEKDKSGIPRTNSIEFCLADFKMLVFYHPDRFLPANEEYKEKRSQYTIFKTEMNRQNDVRSLGISWVYIVYRSREES